VHAGYAHIYQSLHLVPERICDHRGLLGNGKVTGAGGHYEDGAGTVGFFWSNERRQVDCAGQWIPFSAGEAGPQLCRHSITGTSAEEGSIGSLESLAYGNHLLGGLAFAEHDLGLPLPK
jgi:hypothetical protein